jgi:L-seryl-tRNA(Ser) seleniumtransferase
VAETDDPRRGLPAIETLLNHPQLAAWQERIAPEFIAVIARTLVAEERTAVEKGHAPANLEAILKRCSRRLEELLRPSLKRVINATGVILHTGLGRAPLSADAARAIQEASGYTALEFNLTSGERGDRQIHVEPLLCLLTGAEAALVVNNNAAALYLVLNALGYRREVIVSRGQLIEIGGSFRLPDIMDRSGVKLVEVGTTNRTRTDDYRAAITPKTALLLRAHPSNYRIEGFTESVAIADLVSLGREYGIPVVDDLGSGVLWDWTKFGLPYEPTVAESLSAGADLVLVSGDKALGGPQAGIILGPRELVAKLKKSPLARILRPDKSILAALSATLRQFLVPERAAREVPVWHMMTTPVESLRSRAIKLRDRLARLTQWQNLEVRDSEAEAGSGTMPTMTLPSVAICCLPKGESPAKWARRLRQATVPIVATVKHDLVWLDLRTIAASDEDDLVASISSSLKKDGG